MHSADDVRKEVKEALPKIAFHLFSTKGMPLELFNGLLNEYHPTLLDQFIWVREFKRRHPKIFNARTRH